MPRRTKPRVAYVVTSERLTDTEYVLVRQTLERDGVDVIATAAYVGSDTPDQQTVSPTLPIHEARAADLDALIIGSGERYADYTGATDAAVATRLLIVEFMRSKKPVAAIGTGVAILADAGVLRTKAVACPPEIRDQVIAAGALPNGDPVVTHEVSAGYVDIVTGRDRTSAADFARALLRVLPKPDGSRP
jgi:putative intracellular protease/amidase